MKIGNHRLFHRGRGIAYLGLLVGIGASIAANVAHSYVPPGCSHVTIGTPCGPPGWSPPTGAVISAVFWPVALLLALEILARVPWPAGGWWQLVRWGGLVPVAAVAAIVSYLHMSGLLAWYGESPLTYTIGPLAVDGLMVMSAGALLATRPTLVPEQTASEPCAEPAQVPESDSGEIVTIEAPENEPAPDEDQTITVVPPDVRKTTHQNGHQISRRRRRSAVALAVERSLAKDGPGTVAELVLRTGKKRTAIDYALANPLADDVVRDGNHYALRTAAQG